MKKIRVVEKLPHLPQPFHIRDWRETALAYDRFVFDETLEGPYLPLIWTDKTHHNMETDTFGLMSYVGKYKQGGNGTQEAINVVGAVLGATLVGVDKTKQYGKNFVDMLRTFYKREEGVFVWYPNVGSGYSFWYEIQPTVLYYALASFYPDEPHMKEIMRKLADRWREAIEVLKDRDGQPNFNWTAFDFRNMVPVDNDRWREPDSASGIAMLMYLAYARFGDERYLEGVDEALAFLERQEDNPFYELLMYYAPYVAARMNAEHGRRYDVGKLLNWIFDEGAKVRSGWGTVTERWGAYDMHGLIGSLKDNEGYAFAMNGFHLFSVLAPLVRYDPRFAKHIGRWMLNLANQSRYFYADELPAKFQSCPDWEGDPAHSVPYEGIRKTYEGVSPYASGDATVNGWGATDFSLYSGSYVGFMAGLIEKTNVEGILQIDCLKTDYYSRDAYPTYLYYNPYGSAQKVVIERLGEEPVDLYDTIARQFVAENVTDRASFELPAHDAIAIVVVPSGGKREQRDGQLWIDGVFVAPAPQPSVNLCGLSDRQTVSGVVKLNVETFVPEGDKIAEIVVTFGKKQLFRGQELPQPFYVDTDDFRNGVMHLRVELTTIGGGRDSSEVGLILKNPANSLIEPN